MSLTKKHTFTAFLLVGALTATAFNFVQANTPDNAQSLLEEQGYTQVVIKDNDASCFHHKGTPIRANFEAKLDKQTVIGKICAGRAVLKDSIDVKIKPN